MKPSSQRPRTHQHASPLRIAVATDDSFCFHYLDSLHLLQGPFEHFDNAGGGRSKSGIETVDEGALCAELVPFSPLADSQLPDGTNGVIIGGGYPEMHLPQLSSNHSMRKSLAEFGRAGGVIYAECGGLMYLSQYIRPASEGDCVHEQKEEQGQQQEWPMVGLLPFGTQMTRTMKMGLCPHRKGSNRRSADEGRRRRSADVRRRRRSRGRACACSRHEGGGEGCGDAGPGG